MPDLDPQEWPRFICVETANVKENAVTLQPGEKFFMDAEIATAIDHGYNVYSDTAHARLGGGGTRLEAERLEVGGHEVRGQRNHVLEDLSALNALYRPGPLKSGMVDDYISRKQGKTDVKYELQAMKPKQIVPSHGPFGDLAIIELVTLMDAENLA